MREKEKVKGKIADLLLLLPQPSLTRTRTSRLVLTHSLQPSTASASTKAPVVLEPVSLPSLLAFRFLTSECFCECVCVREKAFPAAVKVND